MALKDTFQIFSFFDDSETVDPDAPRTHEMSLAEYDVLLSREGFQADVPADLLKAICWYSSGWRQYDVQGDILSTPTNHGTAYGAMQLNPVWHPDAFPDAKVSAEANIAYTAQLLRWLYDQTGDWRRATNAFFGHDRSAERAARKTYRYLHARPWEEHPAFTGNSSAASDDAAIGQ